MGTKAKRGNGEGSLYERRDKRGRSKWVAALAYRGNRYVEYAASKSEARAELNRLIQKRDAGKLRKAQDQTVSEYLEHWLSSSVKPQRRPSTYRLYKSMIGKHVALAIGNMKLDKLEPKHVHELLSAMRESGKSGAVRQKVYNIIRAAMRTAVRLRVISENPAAELERPRTVRRPIEYLNPAQVKALFKVAKDDRLLGLYELAVYTGLRQGELLALRWSDVNLKGGSITVQHTLSPVDRSLCETKTAGSVRRVELGVLAKRSLRRHQARMLSEGKRACEFVFCDTDGGPLHKSNMLRRSFRPLVAKAKLPPITFHELRHTCATLLLSQGANVKAVQELLGHSSSKTTLDVYAHVMPTMQREAIGKLDRILA